MGATGAARRDLRLLCAGVLVSTAGTAMTGLAVALHLRPHGSAAVAAGLAAAIAPAATGAFWAGPMVDRHRAKPLIVSAGTVSAAAVLLASQVARRDGPVLLMLGLVVVMGLGAAVSSPALAALVPALVGEEEATRGYGSFGAARSTGNLAGFALTGIIVEAFGAHVALLIDAASFVALIAAVALLRGDRDPQPETGGRTRALAGVGLLHRDVVLRVVIGGLALAVISAILIDVAGVFYVVEVVPGGSPVWFGIASTAWGAGSVLGAKAAGRLDGVAGTLRGLGAAHLVMAVALVACGSLPAVAVVIVTWLVAGAANGAQNVCVQAVIRARAQPHLRGRAFSAASSTFQTATVGGLGLGAAAVPALGAQGAVAAAGALPAVAGVLTLLLTRRGTR